MYFKENGYSVAVKNVPFGTLCHKWNIMPQMEQKDKVRKMEKKEIEEMENFEEVGEIEKNGKYDVLIFNDKITEEMLQEEIDQSTFFSQNFVIKILGKYYELREIDINAS